MNSQDSPQNASIPSVAQVPDVKTRNLIATVSGILGLISWYASTVDEYSVKLGLEKPSIAALIGALLLIVTTWMKWPTVSGILEKIRGGIARHISTLLLLISVCILAINIVLLASATSAASASAQLLTYSSTRFVGMFPGGMPTITKLIDDSTESVEVLTDHLAFGALSSPASFEPYRLALINAAAKHSVTVVAFSRQTREAAVAAQFKSRLEAPDFKKVFFDPETSFWQDFLRLNKGYTIPEDWASFLALVDRKNDEIARSFSTSRISVRQIDEEAPILIWIADRKVAVFSFHNREGKEMAMLTSDPQVVAMLGDTFAFYKNLAEDYK